MTDREDPHVPSPEFVAALERELLEEIRATPPIAVERTHTLGHERRPWGRRERLAAAALVALGLTVGAGGQIAYAQAQGAQQRTALEREKGTEREILAMRLQVAREERDRVVASMQAGAATRQAVAEAELEVRRREFAIARLELDLAEIRATSAAPRTELWAPKVGERDFVQERLRVEAAERQEELRMVEMQAQQALTSSAAGATMHQRAELEARRAQVESEFQRTALELRLRERFLAERLSAEEVAKQSADDRLRIDLIRVRRMLEAAAERLKLAQQRFAVGAGVQLDVKRAELEVLERRAELERLEREAAVRQRAERRPE